MPDFARMMDELQYNLIVLVAGIHWSLQKAVLMAGYTVKLINDWLIEHAFVPIIAQTNDSLQVAVGYVFIIALLVLVLGLTYMLAAIIRLDVVSPRNAIIWYVAGALFFTVGPSLYQGMNDFRLNISQAMYVSVLNGLNNNAGDFSSLAQVNSNDLELGTLCDQFDVYLPGATGPGPIDGLDIAMAYLRGHAEDVMGYAQPVNSPGCELYMQNPNPSTWAGTGGSSVVPMDWNLADSYFDHNTSPITWDGVEAQTRTRAVSRAGASQQRALTAWPLLLFGLVEQIVHLLITIAMGITFVSFGIAILFAFFKRTESIAHSIINQWIELIVQTVIIALIQGLVIGFFLAGAATGSAAAIVGIGVICLVFMLITMWSGIKAVWNSFNRLFNAMSQVTGGVMLSPGSAALATAGAGALATGAAVAVGSNALAGMSALNQGATMAQAAGISFGGSHTLSGAARTLAYLPGARNTSLGEAAEQFTEGSVTRQVARNVPIVGRVAGPVVGAKLLSNRDPDRADYNEQGQVINRPMLVPAVGEGLDTWTLPRASRDSPKARTRSEFFEDAEGEMLPGNLPNRVRPGRMGTYRMGTFTPESPVTTANNNDLNEQRRQERSTYASEMQSEEMEQHVSDALRAHTGTHSTLGAMLGQLRLEGVSNVASVLGDVMSQVQSDRQQSGLPANAGMDHIQVADHMARMMGVTPQEKGGSPIQQDLARFGLFVNQALRLGLTPQQTDQIVREVQTSPDGKMPTQTRELLDKQVQTTQGVSWVKARNEVDRLEHGARMLPTEISAYGAVPVPIETAQAQVSVKVDPTMQVNVQPATDASYDKAVKKESQLGGSGNVIGG
ncbi:hypothetical protein G4Y79_18805 [Phototrophicus methaneseepsis]|uniref:Uncharacterized protein n=1 Tax=Phototrophicus methaneseepsis TaxID=2710758 RepID=A0A7S8E7E8_9CHLR|nr:hypothetical protein [Phototrophicus methaneseepsis]QPC81722.1 hypothetical protein G4Y79_18805 [Phototrophicus methaneseepsis]